ncbi:IS630 transposase-related protein [Wolbachia endosymbiont (group A) of Colletes cunicularius]|uniref:IS630 transposase-related protein n=1 Tax=Wolbachia endosymbiont (group A) of Colletes cunicularius TaxID=3139321 RepID=UPI0035C8C550
MMAKPYSEDLRERVLKVVDEKKMTMEEVSKMFKIDRKTIYWWRKRREETGSIKPSSGYQKGHSHKIKYLEPVFKLSRKELRSVL